MDQHITTFAVPGELDKARLILEQRNLPFQVISAAPAYARVGTAALIVEQKVKSEFYLNGPPDFICSGWVEYRPLAVELPTDNPPHFPEDVFGEARIMVFQPCVADAARVRSIAHISGDLSPALPYLNAVMPEASYNPHSQILSYMANRRMVSLYPRRITVAKADDLFDLWKMLESIRIRVNECWARRHELQPSDEMRKKPPALEIFSRLPKTNCGKCGENTCLAFAVKLWNGQAGPRECPEVFGGNFRWMEEALLQICTGWGASQGSV